jgi:hypothetical protein
MLLFPQAGTKFCTRTKQDGKYWLLTLELRVEYRAASYEIRGGRIGNAAGISPTSFGFPLLIVSPTLFHTHLSPLPSSHAISLIVLTHL